jgi:hypothetical protein
MSILVQFSASSALLIPFNPSTLLLISRHIVSTYSVPALPLDFVKLFKERGSLDRANILIVLEGMPVQLGRRSVGEPIFGHDTKNGYGEVTS